jgi:flagellar biosynthesis/type III secretory pathway M-ring protein FliF/YscJ
VGVTPNVGTPTGGPATAASGESNTEEQMGHPVDWDRTQTERDKGRGEVKEMTVSIDVPHKYFEDIEHSKLGDASAKIDEAKLQTTITSEMTKITDQAKMLIGAKDDTSVKVSWFYGELKDDKAEESGPSLKDGLLASLSSWGPSVGLGVLALAALGMVWSVVRKIQPVAGPPETVAAPVEGMTEGLTLDSILEGVELEADTIRASKMQEQISSMVKEDPESVANLVKRWIVQE